MKYTICGYSQKTLLKYKLDGNDAVILRTIADIYSSCSSKLDFINHEEDRYLWLTYKYLFNELLILGTERTLINRINTLVEKNIFKKIVMKVKNGKHGKYMYLSFGENYYELLEKQSEEKQTEEVKNFHEGDEKISGGVMKNFHIKDPSIINPSIIIKKNNTHRAHVGVPIVEDILKKYRECNLPEFEFAPKNHVIMECLNTLGAEKLFKAFEMMKESSFVKNNFSINMVFNIENLKKALNGSFKDKIIVKQEKKIASNLGIYHDKEYADNEDYENMMRALGLSD